MAQENIKGSSHLNVLTVEELDLFSKFPYKEKDENEYDRKFGNKPQEHKKKISIRKGVLLQRG